jgi:hypothetical protein
VSLGIAGSNCRRIFKEKLQLTSEEEANERDFSETDLYTVTQNF